MRKKEKIMKKKLFLVIAIVAVLACLFAISVSAAEPNYDGEKVTLADGTECPLWDEEGNPLIWYVSATAEDGTKTYSYVDATSSAVDYNGGYSASTGGVKWYQLSSVTVTVDGTSYGKSTFVVLNLMSENVKITSGQNVGNHVTCLSKTFTDSKTLEYVYLPLDTVDLNGEVFKNCTALKYVNIAELTELREVGSQDFNLGSVKQFMAGQTLDLSNTKITAIATNGFACCSATEIILPSTLTSVGSDAFKYCSSAEKITFNSTLTSISTGNLFRGCTNLESIEGFAPTVESGIIKSIGNYMFENCKKLKNIDGLMTDGVLIIPEGVTTISSACAFTECDEIVYVEFPSTITYVGQAAFSFCDKLQLVSFDKVDAKIRAAIANGESYTKVDFNNCGTFKGCKSLVALSVPEGTTAIINRFVAQGCTSLTAFYMPNTVTSFGTNGGGQGPFCDANSMYFVQEPFTVGQCLVDGKVDLSKLVLPEKPEVYYMPTAFTGFSGHIETNQYSKDGTMFRNCTSLNSVIVFAENFVTCNANNMFQGVGTKDSPKTVVFTGDIQQYITNKNASYISFVFTNKNDKSPADIGITRVNKVTNTDSYMYFCESGLKYSYASTSELKDADAIGTFIASLESTSETKHVRNKFLDDSTPADCVNPEISFTFCFCGYDLGAQETAPALGHAKDLEADEMWNYGGNYYANAVYVYHCTRCLENYDSEDEVADSALFVNLGYSSIIDGEGESAIGSLVTKTLVNVKVVEKYNNTLKGETIKYGIIVGGAGSETPVNADGTVNGTYAVCKFDGTKYANVEMKISGINSGAFATKLYCATYVILNGEVSYLTDGAISKTAQAITFNDFLGNE